MRNKANIFGPVESSSNAGGSTSTIDDSYSYMYIYRVVDVDLSSIAGIVDVDDPI